MEAAISYGSQRSDWLQSGQSKEDDPSQEKRSIFDRCEENSVENEKNLRKLKSALKIAEKFRDVLGAGPSWCAAMRLRVALAVSFEYFLER